MTVLAVSTFFQVVFGSMLVIAVMILWVAAIVDVIRTQRHSGLRLAAMLVLILIVPILGPLLYFAFNRGKPASAEEMYMAQADQHRELSRRPVGGP